MQHVQVPNMDLKAEGLKTIDPFIYACIKRYMNSKTNSSFPSMTTLMKDSGMTKPPLIRSINRLEKAGYISVKREFGKSSVYTFNDIKKFEIFSYEFITNEALTPKEKAYLVASQQYMFKHPSDSTGSITFTTQTLAEKLGLSYHSLKKYEESLQAKNILSLVPIKNDNATGLPVYERVYQFAEFFNLLALKFQQTDEKLEEHDKAISQVTAELEQYKTELEKIKAILAERNINLEEKEITL